jgi:hypothetical protein
MKIKYEGKISSMSQEEVEGMGSWVEICFDPTSSSVQEGGKGPDSKESLIELFFLVKPLVAEQLRYGQRLVVTIQTSPEIGLVDE